ncbi:hypothetical protein BDZ89DRAFT_279219 [Hymenopellis radicata]|nr:hypothetical protein BDZ89DRAFT_279219 [Hymenopellis radicata]
MDPLNQWKCSLCNVVEHVKNKNTHIKGKRHRRNQQQQPESSSWTCSVCGLAVAITDKDIHVATHLAAAQAMDRGTCSVCHSVMNDAAPASCSRAYLIHSSPPSIPTGNGVNIPPPVNIPSPAAPRADATASPAVVPPAAPVASAPTPPATEEDMVATDPIAGATIPVKNMGKGKASAKAPVLQQPILSSSVDPTSGTGFTKKKTVADVADMVARLAAGPEHSLFPTPRTQVEVVTVALGEQLVGIAQDIHQVVNDINNTTAVHADNQQQILEHVDARSDVLDSRMDAMQVRQAVADANSGAFGQALAGLESKVAQTSSSLAEQRNDIHALHRAVDSLHHAVDSLVSRIDTMTTTIVPGTAGAVLLDNENVAPNESLSTARLLPTRPGAASQSSLVGIQLPRNVAAQATAAVTSPEAHSEVVRFSPRIDTETGNTMPPSTAAHVLQQPPHADVSATVGPPPVTAPETARSAAQAVNAPTTGQTPTTGSNSWTCGICSMTTMHVNNKDAHLAGAKHHRSAILAANMAALQEQNLAHAADADPRRLDNVSINNVGVGGSGTAGGSAAGGGRGGGGAGDTGEGDRVAIRDVKTVYGHILDIPLDAYRKAGVRDAHLGSMVTRHQIERASDIWNAQRILDDIDTQWEMIPGGGAHSDFGDSDSDF